MLCGGGTISEASREGVVFTKISQPFSEKNKSQRQNKSSKITRKKVGVEVREPVTALQKLGKGGVN